MTATFAVTVPGPTVTLAVSVEQVVAYLERTGWTREPADNGWARFNVAAYDFVLWVSEPRWIESPHRAEVIEYIAMVEEREQSDVLRDIAAVT